MTFSIFFPFELTKGKHTLRYVLHDPRPLFRVRKVQLKEEHKLTEEGVESMLAIGHEVGRFTTSRGLKIIR